MKIIKFLSVLLLCAICYNVNSQDTQLLNELIVISGKQKHKKMFGTGIKIPYAATSFTTNNIGTEIGCIIKNKYTFEIEEIDFTILSNNIEGVILGIEIYSIDSLFTKILPHSIKKNIPVGKKQVISIIPEKQVIIAPGEYFVAVRFVSCNENNINKEKINIAEKQIIFPLYIKNSYIRKKDGCSIEKCKINLGLKIKGSEYR